MTGNAKKGKGLSIGAAMKHRMASGETVQDEASLTDAATPLNASAAEQGTETADLLESFNTRLPRSLQKRLKVYVAVEGSKIQDVVQQALSEYLERHGG